MADLEALWGGGKATAFTVASFGFSWVQRLPSMFLGVVATPIGRGVGSDGVGAGLSNNLGIAREGRAPPLYTLDLVVSVGRVILILELGRGVA